MDAAADFLRRFLLCCAALLFAALLVGSFFVGCGPHQRSSVRVSSPPAHRSPVTVALWRAHLVGDWSGQERQLVDEALRHHWAAVGQLHFAVQFHLGGTHPQNVLDVYVHRERTLGPQYMAEVLGRVAPDGSVHVVAGEGLVLPDLVHWSMHAWFAPFHDSDERNSGLALQFWDEVMRKQEASVRLLKITRGVP